jgi:O-antigen/teichoic acid export membrane protein
VTFVVNAVQASWVPYKFHIHAEDSDPQGFFRSVLVYYVAGISYLWVGVSLWGPDTVRLTASDFHEAGALVWATALIPVMQGLFFMSGTGLELSDNTKPLPLTSLLGLITVASTSFLFVKLWGPLGAALAAALGWLAMATLLNILSQRSYAIPYDWATMGCIALVAATFVFLGSLAQSLPLVPRLLTIVAMSAAYPLLMFLLLLRSRDERGRMRHLLTKFRLAPAAR